MNPAYTFWNKYRTALGVGVTALSLYKVRNKFQPFDTTTLKDRLVDNFNASTETWYGSKLAQVFNFRTKSCADWEYSKPTYDPKFKTDVYVWGNGVVLNDIMDYSNYFPKKIKNFSHEESPVIISVKFGLYHEAYLDTEGRVHVCEKYKIPSRKVEGQDDGFRQGFINLGIEGEHITEIQFTKNRLFALTSNGNVYLWLVTKKEQTLSLEMSIDDMFSKGISNEESAVIDQTPYQIKELRNIVSIKTGEDHFLGLDDEGTVWAMGDDKFGQCGQFNDGRPIVPPFKEVRIGKPQRVNLQEKITKIACGTRHSLAVTDRGRLYGWGYNHQVQLSHGENLASATTQKLVIFEPVTITREIDSHVTVLVDGGEDYSIFVTEDANGDQHFWSTGNNLRGQLGINMTTHFHDVTPMHFEDEPIEPVKFEFLSCGRRHSLLALRRGGLFMWGDNEQGQIGNK